MPADFGRYAKREYERRWLLRALPAAVDPNRPWSRITDHYLDGTRFRVPERVRLSDGEIAWKLTQKFPEDDARSIAPSSRTPTSRAIGTRLFAACPLGRAVARTIPLP